jgi:hypothetical protein
MEIDKLVESADIVRFIQAQRIKCWGISNDWTKQDQPKTIRLDTYENQTSRKTKITMAREYHGRFKKAESQNLEGES